MAKNNNMLFTYPILCNFNDDYKDVTFVAGSTGKMTKTSKKSTIETYVKIGDEKINKLLDKKALKIIIKVFGNTFPFKILPPIPTLIGASRWRKLISSFTASMT